MSSELVKKIYILAEKDHARQSEQSSNKKMNYIDEGKTSAFRFKVDVNNDGDQENVMEYQSSEPYARAINYIVEKDGALDRRFYSDGNRPLLIGQFVVFNGKTYLADLNNVSRSGSNNSNKNIFYIYRTRKSPMQDKSGVLVEAKDPVCSFNVINKAVAK